LKITQLEGPAESPQEGGRPNTSYALLGYPRSRKNGGHSEAGAQPCRFIARRATNGAPPSEATQPKGEHSALRTVSSNLYSEKEILPC
jgi:hypothetical protein